MMKGSTTNNNHFIVLVTVHNSREWIGKCLDSVISQRWKNYDLVVIDDHSTDGTWDIIQEYECLMHRNSERYFHSLISMVSAIPYFCRDPQDVIVSLDGDDWLSDNTVLEYLNSVYTPDIWLTYGQYEPLSKTYSMPCRPIDPRTYRKSGEWRVSHLKTFRRFLWDRIKDDDFRSEDGNYLVTCGDLAMMYPMIEMAGAAHIKLADRVLMIYNDANPASHTKTIPQVSLDTAKYLQSLSCYEPID